MRLEHSKQYRNFCFSKDSLKGKRFALTNKNKKYTKDRHFIKEENQMTYTHRRTRTRTHTHTCMHMHTHTFHVFNHLVTTGTNHNTIAPHAIWKVPLYSCRKREEQMTVLMPLAGNDDLQPEFSVTLWGKLQRLTTVCVDLVQGMYGSKHIQH